MCSQQYLPAIAFHIQKTSANLGKSARSFSGNCSAIFAQKRFACDAANCLHSHPFYRLTLLTFLSLFTLNRPSYLSSSSSLVTQLVLTHPKVHVLHCQTIIHDLNDQLTWPMSRSSFCLFCLCSVDSHSSCCPFTHGPSSPLYWLCQFMWDGLTEWWMMAMPGVMMWILLYSFITLSDTYIIY